jgi:hypothetical protein
MAGRPRWRRILLTVPVAVLAALALCLPATGAATAPHDSHQQLHPYRIGHFHAVGSHWHLKVEHLNRNGNGHVRHADRHNRAAGARHRYVLVRVRGKLAAAGVGSLAYDESFRLLVDGRRHAPAHVFLWHGLPQSGTVDHGEVVVVKIPFRVSRAEARKPMILRALSQLDWQSAPRFFRTTR